MLKKVEEVFPAGFILKLKSAHDVTPKACLYLIGCLRNLMN